MAISIQPLCHNHDVKNFDCGIPALNDWLQRTARQHQDKGISKTYVAVDSKDTRTILGYYAVTICEVRAEHIPAEHKKKLPRAVPGMRLGRLATAVQYQRHELRIGETLLIDAMLRIKQVSTQIGGYALFVDAKSQYAANFYMKYGFVPLPDAPFRLLLPIASIPD